MKILITGTSGFIGSRLLLAACERFGAEHVVALSSRGTQVCEGLVYTDNDPSTASFSDGLLASIDTIIHAGAFIPKRGRDANLIDKCNGNIFFTEKLLALAFRNLKEIIYLSTTDVYDPSGRITEATTPQPSTLYGLSKLYCERLVSISAERSCSVFKILRIGHVFGPGEEEFQKMLPNTIKNILRDEPVEIWGNGEVVRSYIYIDDVVTAVINAIQMPPTVELVNVVGTTPISINTLVKALIEISHKQIEVRRKSADLESRYHEFDVSRLQTHLLHRQTSFAEGLRREYAHIASLV